MAERAEHTEDAEHGERRLDRRFVWALVIGGILNPMNTSSLATALLGISRELGATATDTALLVAVVYIVASVAQPLMGSFATRYGARRVFVLGLLLVMLAGVIGTLAPAVSWLFVARACIGLGTSSAYPSAMMMLRRRAELEGLGPPTRELGLLAASGTVMSAAGLPIGGALVALFGWRAVFFINIPVALATLVMCWAWVPSYAALAEQVGAKQRHEPVLLDPVGILLFAATVGSLATFLYSIRDPRWWALAAALLAGIALVLWEGRVTDGGRTPFLDVRLLGSSWLLSGTYVRGFLLFMTLYGMLYAGSQWLGAEEGLSAALVGLVLLPQSIVSALSSLIAGRFTVVRPLILLSALAMIVAGAMCLVAAQIGSTALMGAGATGLGLAMGVGTVGNQSALYLGSPPAQFGVASGLFRTSTYVGGFVVTALMGVVYANGVTGNGMSVFAGLFVVGGIVTILISRGVPRRV